MVTKPIIGAQQWKSWAENDKNVKKKLEMKSSCKTDRVVAAPSGEMAYAYGTCGSISDEADGKHQGFVTAYLDVWKVVDGSCKLAARQVLPERNER